MGKYIDKKGNLKDNKILKDMDAAKEMYENGELLETARILKHIATAIESWEPNYE